MAKRVKLGSMKYQLTQALNNKKAIGESRDDAKEAHKEYCKANDLPVQNIKAPTVHSTGSMDLYRNYVVKFSEYMQENHKEIKDMNDITKEHAYEYLRTLEDRNLSANTVSTAQSAINKVTDLGLNKAEGGLSGRSYHDNTRSQVPREHDTRYNPDNYTKEIAIAESFGLRRQSLDDGQYKLKENFSIYQNQNGELRACVIEKGGKYREAPCLKAREEDIRNLLGNENIPTYETNESNHMAFTKKDFVETYRACENEYVSNSYTKLIDNHAFRKEYSRNLYNEVENKEHGHMPGVNPKYIQTGFYDKTYDKEVLSQVSVALGHGHGRFQDTVNNYIRG
ncbi:MAG: site-specific integrase [Bacilli bacterium]